MKKDWTIEPGTFGPRMMMRGEWSSAAFKTAVSCEVRELELNHTKGWRGQDLSFLTELANLLEAFTIIDFTVENVSQINDLTLLRFLDVNTYCKTELSFSQFPRLEECSLEWRPQAYSLFQHRGVKRVCINKWNHGKDLTDFSEMKQLESLKLYSPTRLQSLAGIETLTKLAWLELALATRLASLAGIEHLALLQHLELHTCRKIKDIAPIAELRGLREFYLLNCGEIETIKPLRSLQALEKFFFYESTNILDGDLTPLKELPKLKAVAFMERSHYSLTREDLPTL